MEIIYVSQQHLIYSTFYNLANYMSIFETIKEIPLVFPERYSSVFRLDHFVM